MNLDILDAVKGNLGSYDKPGQVFISPQDRAFNGRRNVTLKPISVMSNQVYGIMTSNNAIWFKLIPNQEGDELARMLSKSASKTIQWSELLNGYNGVIAGGRFYFIKKGGGNLIGGDTFWQLFAFWITLRNLIAAKRGIRKEKIPLYLAECIWKTNRSNLNLYDQAKRILCLIQEKYNNKLYDRHHFA